MWKYVLNKMIKQKEAAFFIVMIILSFAVSSAAPYLNGKFIDLLTVSKDIHLIVQFALIIVGVGVVGALLSYCSNLTTVKVLTKTTMASIYEGMDNLLETDLASINWVLLHQIKTKEIFFPWMVIFLMHFQTHTDAKLCVC